MTSGYGGGGFGGGSGKALVFFALVPFLLVTAILSSIFGDWVWEVAPILFIAMGIGLQIFHQYRERLDSPEAFDLGEHGRFSGEEKTRILRGGAWVLFAVTLATVLAVVFLLPMLAG